MVLFLRVLVLKTWHHHIPRPLVHLPKLILISPSRFSPSLSSSLTLISNPRPISQPQPLRRPLPSLPTDALSLPSLFPSRAFRRSIRPPPLRNLKCYPPFADILPVHHYSQLDVLAILGSWCGADVRDLAGFEDGQEKRLDRGEGCRGRDGEENSVAGELKE